MKGGIDFTERLKLIILDERSGIIRLYEQLDPLSELYLPINRTHATDLKM